MKLSGLHKPSFRGRALALVVITVGISALVMAYQLSSRYPETDDAAIDADVVHVASPSAGRIERIAVHDNQSVRKGDLLFEIDPVQYKLAVAQAQADLDLARAARDARRRALAAERANASLAGEQLRRAEQNYALAVRTVERLTPLAAQGYVSAQQYDQAQVAQKDAEVSVAQAREHQRTSVQTIGDEADAIATVHAREAALSRAQQALAETVVRAPQNGVVTGLSVLPGEMLAPAQSVFTLVDAGEWFAVANFRETTLSEIKVGDCATVYAMTDRKRPLAGRVVGIGVGIADGERINLPRSLPIVQKSLNWVRVAQRFPVRVRLEVPDPVILRVGASASVEIRHGSACH